MHHWDQRGPVDPILKPDWMREPPPPPKPRPVILGINVPWPGESWQELNDWRKCYGMSPVEKDWNVKGKQ